MCIASPQLPYPELGFGLSLEPPAIDSFSGDLNLCCKHVAFATPPLVVPLPPFTLSGGVVGAAIKLAISQVQDFLDSLPPDCPLE